MNKIKLALEQFERAKLTEALDAMTNMVGEMRLGVSDSPSPKKREQVLTSGVNLRQETNL